MLVHISVLCPHCRSRYQLDPALAGQRMRCPNSGCRQVFVVEAEAEEYPTTPEPLAQPEETPDVVAVEEPLLPLLSAELAPPVSSEGLRPAPAPRRSPLRTPPPDDQPDAPREINWSEAAPPPRSDVAVQDPASADNVPVLAADEFPAPPPRPSRTWTAADTETEPAVLESADDFEQPPRSRLGLILAGVCLLAMLGVAGAGAVFWVRAGNAEERLRRQAHEAFDKSDYDKAVTLFGDLVNQYGSSVNADDDRFYLDAGRVHQSLAGVGRLNVQRALEDVDQFLVRQKTYPELAAERKKIAPTVVQSLQDLAKEAQGNPDPATIDAINKAEDMLSRGLAGRLEVPAEVRSQLREAAAAARDALAKIQLRKQTITELEGLAVKPSSVTIRQARDLVRERGRVLAELEKAPDVVRIMEGMIAAHRSYVKYFEAKPEPGPATAPATPLEPALVVDPALVRSERVVAGTERVGMIALARGVLYGLGKDTGSVRWVTRVGIDNAALPVRVPPTGGKKERLVLPSADGASLIALDLEDGTTLWRVPLPGPVCGRPLVVEQTAYVAVQDSTVQEIDLDRGKLLGHYEVGQRLATGGTRMEGTSFAFFPAEEGCVFVLDVDPFNRKSVPCPTIVYTDHPAGSLRGEPLVARTDQPQGNALPGGFLVLEQTAGLDNVRLVAFELPPPSAQARPVALEPEPRGRGWPWFPAFRDSEKLLQVTDDATLLAFGTRQPGNPGPPLFPWAESGVRALAASPAEVKRARALVASVQDQNVWVLANDRLQRLELAWDPARGPRLVSRWSLPLGTPLQAGQTEAEDATLYLVTEPPGQNPLASAIDPTDGQLRWQRQLGLFCEGEPLHVADRLLARGKGGGLYLFDPARHPNLPDRPWQIVDNSFLVRPEPMDAPAHAFLLPTSDGTTACEVFSAAKGSRVGVRVYHAGKEGQPGMVREVAPDWTNRKGVGLAGTPAARGESVLLPLDDGLLLRLRLDEGEKPMPREGPTWRATGAGAGARGHAVWLNDEDFVTTNGQRGLVFWKWPARGVFQAVPAGANPNTPSKQLGGNLVGVPVAVPLADGKVGVAVADETGTVTLLGDELAVVHAWKVNGRVTTAPFVVNGRIGCVVDRRRLVWLDPAMNDPQWQYVGNAAIVGRPQLIEDLLVVADESGHFLGLDPKTGQPQGNGYQMIAPSGPATSPVAFGEGRAFAPLDDGTVLLLDLARLRAPKAAGP